MTVQNPILALGLMSGTSCDGIDAALVRTDGRARVECGRALKHPYPDAFRRRLRSVMGGKGAVAQVAEDLTYRHALVVKELLSLADIPPSQVALLGFHGQTVLHEPHNCRTLQIGDGALLARLTGIDTISDFRSADVAAGGQGAPLVPIYHQALAANLPERPIAVLNLGGVGNVTWIGPGEADLIAFDTGPGNALLDDWAMRHTGKPIDEDGRLARAGRVDRQALQALLQDPFFSKPPPKSLDRDAFDPEPVARLSPSDGAATLVAFTAAAVGLASHMLPAAPRRWLISGGGRSNPALMAALARELGPPVEPVEAAGWDGDVLEAQAFAYLAVRSLAGLPLTLPSTTGVHQPTNGGRLDRAG